MKTRTLLITIAIAAFAVAAFAALSPEKAAWAKGPVQVLMTAEEVQQWNALQTDADADTFIATFWARRDPTPGTPENEFEEAFNKRVAVADKNFGVGRTRGALTDRGKIFLLFGGPAKATHIGGGPSDALGNNDRATAAADMEQSVWTYEGEVAQKLFGMNHVELRFSDRLGNRELRLDRPTFDLAAAERRIANAFIVQPNPQTAQTAPKSQRVETVTVPMPETAPAQPTTFKTASLETAITDVKAGKVDSKGATVSYAEFLSPAGDYYVPIGLFVPESVGLTADSADTFFGALEDAAGKRVLVFEEPARPVLSRNASFYDYSANLPSGTYKVILGLAKAGVPVLAATAPLQTSALTKESVGTSKLVLSDIVETIEAAPVKSPFAFGKLKIVPRSSFTNKDELGYFVEIHNPGIDSTTNLPKMQAKVELVQPVGPSISAPLSDVQALPLSGAPGPGEYAVISGIPLSQLSKPLKAGDYTLRVKLVDTLTKKSYTVEQKFKIAG